MFTLTFVYVSSFHCVLSLYMDFSFQVGSSASPLPLPLDAGEKCFAAIKVGARGDKDALTKRH